MIKFAKRIDDNDRLEKISRLYETNRLVDAYNSLLDRHNEFEKKLRDVAEIDSLTNLPNRYCYNEFLRKEIIKALKKSEEEIENGEGIDSDIAFEELRQKYEY